MKRNFSARLLALTMAFVLIIAITGCVNVSEDQAERRIKSYIFTRYGTNYEIGYISYKENQMFGGGSYHTTVTEKESGLSFSVICRANQRTGTVDCNDCSSIHHSVPQLCKIF